MGWRSMLRRYKERVLALRLWVGIVGGGVGRGVRLVRARLATKNSTSAFLCGTLGTWSIHSGSGVFSRIPQLRLRFMGLGY
jgi:hypothetical protein